MFREHHRDSHKLSHANSGGSEPRSNLPSRSLPEEFFNRSADKVARDLVGKQIISTIDGNFTSGIIVETAAYTGKNDAETHLYRGASSKSADWKPGSLYVYSVQGQSMLTIATPPYSEGATVLIRAIEPVDGIEIMQERRGGIGGVKVSQGPGNVAKALGVTVDVNGTSIFEGTRILINQGMKLRDFQVKAGTRVNARKNPELKFRFYIPGNKYVTSPRG